MSIYTKRKIFYAIWVLIMLSGPITIFRNVVLSQVLSSNLVLLNTFQRLTGTMAFSLIFMQIMIGSNMDKFVQILGSKAYRIHIVQGLLVYATAFSHPIFESLIVFTVSRKVADAFFVVIPSLNTQRDILLTFGKMGLALLTIGVVAAYFRTKPVFRKYWRYFHYFNYVVFFLIAFHARVGTDLGSLPFDSFYWAAIVIVSLTLMYKLSIYFKSEIIKSYIPD